MSKKSILNIPIKVDFSDIYSLDDLTIGTGVARQRAFGQVIGKCDWSVDLDEMTITFGDKTFGCSIIGSESDVSDTWLWGWANPHNGCTEEQTAAGIQAREALSECDEFTVPSYELDETRNGHTLSMIITALSEENVAYYRCPYDGGALYVQVKGLPDEAFAPTSVPDIASDAMQIIQGMECDHLLIFAGMLYQNGYEFTATDTALDCYFGEGKLHVDLELVDDGMHRATGVEIS